MSPETALKIATRIEDDIMDRRGLSGEWCAIDAEVKSEIIDRWTDIILEEANAAEPRAPSGTERNQP